MPQPDNQRQSGAGTQTSQRTVAPTGQQAGFVSPIMGGAVSAGPQVQIGQQAQIRSTGGELFQALQGAAQGAARGLEAYQKMYELQSKMDYDKFQQDYTTELDRVNGDPTKMKTWFDSQTYKPNRVTATQYGNLRAQVNQKSYEEDQRDLWVSDLEKTAMMNNADALQYLTDRAATEDENSPWMRQAQTKIIELQGQVAKATRAINLDTMERTYRGENVSILERLRSSPFAQSLGTEEFKLVLANRSLGLVDIDDQGTITVVSTGETFTPDGFTPEIMATLRNEIGTYAETTNAELAMRALRATSLPASSFGKKPVTGTPDRKIVMGLTEALAGSDPSTSFWSVLESNSSTLTDEERIAKAQKLFQMTAASISGNNEISSGEKVRLLGELQKLTVYSDDNPAWASIGIGSQEELDLVLGPKFASGLNDARSELIFDAANEGLTQIAANQKKARTLDEMHAASIAGFDQIVGMLSETGDDANVLMVNGATGDVLRVSLEEYATIGVTRSFPSYLGFGSKKFDGFVPMGVEVLNAEFGEQAPFMFAIREGQFVFEGTGNGNASRAMAGLVEDLNANVRAVVNAEQLRMGNPTQTAANRQDGFSRIVMTGTGEELDMTLLSLTSPEKDIREFFPSGNDEQSKAVWSRVWGRYNPSTIANLSGEERVLRLKAMGAAWTNSSVFRDRIAQEFKANPGEFVDADLEILYTVGPQMDPSLNPEAFMGQIKRISAASRSNTWGNMVAAADNLGTRVGNLFSEQELQGEADWTSLIPSEGGTIEALVFERAAKDYKLVTNGGDLLTDLQDPVNSNARTWFQESLQAQKNILRLVDIGGSTDEAVRDRLANSPVTVSNFPLNPDDLYDPTGNNLTATNQAIDTIITTIIDHPETGGELAAAAAIGLGRPEQLEDFRHFLRTGQVTGRYEYLVDMPDVLRRYAILRNKLASGISLSLSDAPGAGTVAMSQLEIDENTKIPYTSHSYRITLSPDAVRTEQFKLSRLQDYGGTPWFNDKLGFDVAATIDSYFNDVVPIGPSLSREADGLGFTQPIFDLLAGQGVQLTIDRASAGTSSGFPPSMQTGNQVLRTQPNFAFKTDEAFRTPLEELGHRVRRNPLVHGQMSAEEALEKIRSKEFQEDLERTGFWGGILEYLGWN